MGPHGVPWAKWPLTQGFIVPGEAEKFYTGGAWEPKKSIFIKNSRDPGLNHEPRVVFYAEFESGIENNQNLIKNMKYKQFLKL